MTLTESLSPVIVGAYSVPVISEARLMVPCGGTEVVLSGDAPIVTLSDSTAQSLDPVVTNHIQISSIENTIAPALGSAALLDISVTYIPLPGHVENDCLNVIDSDLQHLTSMLALIMGQVREVQVS